MSVESFGDTSGWSRSAEMCFMGMEFKNFGVSTQEFGRGSDFDYLHVATFHGFFREFGTFRDEVSLEYLAFGGGFLGSGVFFGGISNEDKIDSFILDDFFLEMSLLQ